MAGKTSRTIGKSSETKTAKVVKMAEKTTKVTITKAVVTEEIVLKTIMELPLEVEIMEVEIGEIGAFMETGIAVTKEAGEVRGERVIEEEWARAHQVSADETIGSATGESVTDFRAAAVIFRMLDVASVAMADLEEIFRVSTISQIEMVSAVDSEKIALSILEDRSARIMRDVQSVQSAQEG